MTDRSDLVQLFDRTPTRRRALGLLGSAGIAVVLGACGSDEDAATSTSTSTTGSAGGGSSTTGGSTTAATATTAAGECATTPGETGGPFPADGSNDDGNGSTANVLDDSAVTRSDIRSDLDGSDTQEGVPMTLRMRILDSSASCAPLAGAAVYVWHCNREGEYSQYDSPMIGGDFTAFSWLRGVQVTDDAGQVEFRTILPGRYQGRAFHIHFEVYDDASFGTKLLTSQLAADDDEIERLYIDAGYDQALRAETTNSSDNVFGDGVSRQLLTFSGDVSSGLTGAVDVTV